MSKRMFSKAQGVNLQSDRLVYTFFWVGNCSDHFSGSIELSTRFNFGESMSQTIILSGAYLVLGFKNSIFHAPVCWHG